MDEKTLQEKYDDGYRHIESDDGEQLSIVWGEYNEHRTTEQ